jgi:hypothetical protein
MNQRKNQMLVKMEVYQDGDTWCARGIGQDIFTQGQTADELFRNIKEAVALHFENGSESPDIDILVVSELKLPHAPAASS